MLGFLSFPKVRNRCRAGSRVPTCPVMRVHAPSQISPVAAGSDAQDASKIMSQMRLVCVAKLCGHGSQIDIWMRSDPLGSLLQLAPLCQHPRSLWRPLVHHDPRGRHLRSGKRRARRRMGRTTGLSPAQSSCWLSHSVRSRRRRERSLDSRFLSLPTDFVASTYDSPKDCSSRSSAMRTWPGLNRYSMSLAT